MHFMECGGNSGANAGPEPPQLTAGGIHGLLSCSEWTGVKLGLLLDEAGVQPEGKWMLAESGDAASLSRSIPLKEAHEQGILALYQNGERLRPEQGYPLRLLMPGWEGNLNIKWLHRIKVTTSEHDQGRDLEIHPVAEGRQSAPVQFHPCRSNR